MQHQHAVGGFGFFNQVAGPQHAAATLAHVVVQGTAQVAAALGVEADGGLVHQQQAGPVQQRAHQFDLAPVATRQLAHQAGQLGAKTGGFAAGEQPLGGHGARQAVQVGVEAQVAFDAQVEVERHRLEHHADVAQRSHRAAAQRVAIDPHLAFVGGEQAGEHLEQGRLAGAIGPQQRHERARLQRQRQPFEGRAVAVALRQAVDLQAGWGAEGALGG